MRSVLVGLVLLLGVSCTFCNAQSSYVYLWPVTFSGAWSGSDTWLIAQHPTANETYSVIHIDFAVQEFDVTFNYTIVDQLLPSRFRPWFGVGTPSCDPQPPGASLSGRWFKSTATIDGTLQDIWIHIRCDLRVEIWPPHANESYFSSYSYAVDSGPAGSGISYIAHEI